MSLKIKYGFKFCGNCNPVITASEIYKNIKLLAEQFKDLEVLPKDCPELDYLIVINGCPVDCAERPAGNYEEIVIAGETLDMMNCNKDEIALKVIDKMKYRKK